MSNLYDIEDYRDSYDYNRELYADCDGGAWHPIVDEFYPLPEDDEPYDAFDAAIDKMNGFIDAIKMIGEPIPVVPAIDSDDIPF